MSTLWAYLVFIEPVTTDPNQARRAAMDADERRKYDIAYYGDDLVRAIEASSDGVIEMEPGGCLGGAKEGLTTEAPSFEGVEYVNEVEERLKGSPSYVLAEQEWARCVGELGYDVQRPSEVFDWLEAKLYEIGRNAIERDIIVTDDPTSLTEQSPDALIVSDADAALLGARSPYSGEELAEVQAFEVQFALDIRECDVGFHVVTRELREAIEAEFL